MWSYLERFVAGADVTSAIFELIQSQLPLAVHREEVASATRKVHSQRQFVKKSFQGTDIASWLETKLHAREERVAILEEGDTSSTPVT